MLQAALQLTTETSLMKVVLLNEIIQVIQISYILDSQNSAVSITLLVILIVLGIYTIFTLKAEHKTNSYFRYIIFIFLLIAQTEVNPRLSLIMIQIVLVDVYIKRFICIQTQTLASTHVTILSLAFLIQIYVYVRTISQSTVNYAELIFGILFLIIFKIINTIEVVNRLHQGPYAQDQPKSLALHEDLQDSNISLNNINIKREINLFKAFDIFPQGVIILTKDIERQFNISYVNSAIQQLFETKISDEISKLLQGFQSENVFSHQTIEQIYDQSLSQGSSSVQHISQNKNNIKLFHFVPSFANISQQENSNFHFSIAKNESEKFIFRQIKQNNSLVPVLFESLKKQQQNRTNKYSSMNQVNEQNKHNQLSASDLKFSMFNAISPNKEQSNKNNNESLAGTVKYISSGSNSKEIVGLWDLMNQMWDQTKGILSKNKTFYQEDRPLLYILESELFYTQVKGDKQKWLEIKVFTALHKQQPITLLTVRDVSYRDYIKSLKNQTSQKSKTLDFVSHEFRTPLNCIIAMLKTVLDKKQIKNKEDLHLLQSALANSEYCLNLSQDLLDLAQIKSGKFQININRFNISETMMECINMFQIQADKSNIKLILENDQFYNHIIFSDKKRIKQVTINLIGNALKFTLKGKIIIRCKEDKDNFIVIEVEDTGIGVKFEDQQKLFKAFGKIKNQETAQLNEQGVGLGLIISNQICEQLSDSTCGLGFSSEYGKGTIFCFRIKNHKSMKEDYDLGSDLNLDQSLGEKLESLDLKGMTKTLKRPSILQPILLVDDNQFNIEALLHLITKYYPLVPVNFTISGYLAEEMCEEGLSKLPFSLIFMDIEMPFQDGVVTAKHIKEMYKQAEQSVKIFGCTAHSLEKNTNTYADVFDEYIEKPVNKGIIEKIMNKYYYN